MRAKRTHPQSIYPETDFIVRNPDVGFGGWLRRLCQFIDFCQRGSNGISEALIKLRSSPTLRQSFVSSFAIRRSIDKYQGIQVGYFVLFMNACTLEARFRNERK
jgi:hypothetical protein